MSSSGSNPGEYVPAPNGAIYPDGSFGRDLQSVAQMIKMQLGLAHCHGGLWAAGTRTSIKVTTAPADIFADHLGASAR